MHKQYTIMTELDIAIKLLVVHLSFHVWKQSKQLC